MKKIDLGPMVAVLANIGVIAGILMEKEVNALTETERNRLRVLGIRVLLTMEQNFQDILNDLQSEDQVLQMTKSIYDRPVLNSSSSSIARSWRKVARLGRIFMFRANK